MPTPSVHRPHPGRPPEAAPISAGCLGLLTAIGQALDLPASDDRLTGRAVSVAGALRALAREGATDGDAAALASLLRDATAP